MRRILLNPGPATTSDRVKRALVIEDVCPREPEFTERLRDVRARLAKLAGPETETTAIVLPGSGTAAVEAMLGSFVGDGFLVVVDNGDYGKRMSDIADRLNLRHVDVKLGWGAAIDVGRLEAALRESKDRPTHLAVVHHETSTGMLNPLDDIVDLCRRLDILLLVDAMSSFGVLPTPVGAGGIAALAASANKCLHGMAGLSFVIASRAAVTAAAASPRRSLYFDLISEAEHLERTGQSRFTMPPQILSALREAILELEEEGGPAARLARYRRNMATLMNGLRDLGFELLLADEHQSGILVAIREPAQPWFDFQGIHDALYARGFTIYPGKPQAPPTFRLSILGDLQVADVESFVAAFGEEIARRRGSVS